MPNLQLNPNTTRWQAQNALGLAMASQLAYENAATIDATVKKWGFKQSTFIATPDDSELDTPDTQLFLASNDEMVLVAFRGTGNLNDWITDADVKMAKTELGLVHDGFWSALDPVWKPLQDAIAQHQNQAQSLWFTGHSLGAALATLAVAAMRLELKPIHGLYTFGSPRAGSLDFTDRFDQDFGGFTFRYVNNSDVVTRVPTREMGYSHVGTSLTFDADGAVHADMHFWNKFLERMKGDLNEFLHGKFALFNDHAIQNYVTNADRNRDKNPF
jgi:triacylglycerol lipase